MEGDCNRKLFDYWTILLYTKYHKAGGILLLNYKQWNRTFHNNCYVEPDFLYKKGSEIMNEKSFNIECMNRMFVSLKR